MAKDFYNLGEDDQEVRQPSRKEEFRSEEEDDKERERQERLAELAKLEPISFDELNAVFHKWMLIPDPGIIKFICAFYCANKLARKAVWAIIVAPSGGGKTEFLNALHDLEDIYEISLLTPNTFLSGMPGPKDASLLPKLTGKIMVFKDWTSVLSMQRDAKAEIMSQFREIWDGTMRKIFGTGKVRTWTGKVSLLAASTQAVDMSQQQFTHLGERFINYRLIMPDRKEVARRSIENDSSQELMTKELRNAMYAFFKGMDLTKITDLPELDDDVITELVNLSNFCSMARSGVIRDWGMKKEVIFVPAAEMPTRIIQQLNAVASGLAMINNGKLMEEDMDILYKLALDSIPITNKMVMMEMAKADGQTTAEIATALDYPTETIRIYLENLTMLKICRRQKDSGKADRWTMNEEFSEMLRHYEKIEQLSAAELKSRSEEIEKEFDDIPDPMPEAVTEEISEESLFDHLPEDP